jgi:hypothetical protein
MTDEISLLRKMSSNDREDLVLTAMEQLILRYDERRMLALIWRLWEEKPVKGSRRQARSDSWNNHEVVLQRNGTA